MGPRGLERSDARCRGLVGRSVDGGATRTTGDERVERRLPERHFE